MSTKPTESKAKRVLWRVLGVMFAVILLLGAVGYYRIRRRLPPELMQDIRSGLAARHIPDADQRFEKYLELRYGPQSDPANRQKAFLDFFNPDHIRALQLMVKHSPEDSRAANINATAKWVEKYRVGLSAQDRTNLVAQLQTPAGQTMLQRATAQYNSQDVEYRGQTAIVISQLLKTIASLPRQ